jgi:hypothetical protein
MNPSYARNQSETMKLFMIFIEGSQRKKVRPPGRLRHDPGRITQSPHGTFFFFTTSARNAMLVHCTYPEGPGSHSKFAELSTASPLRPTSLIPTSFHPSNSLPIP